MKSFSHSVVELFTQPLWSFHFKVIKANTLNKIDCANVKEFEKPQRKMVSEVMWMCIFLLAFYLYLWKEVVLKSRYINFLNFLGSGCSMKALKTSYTSCYCEFTWWARTTFNARESLSSCVSSTSLKILHHVRTYVSTYSLASTATRPPTDFLLQYERAFVAFIQSITPFVCSLILHLHHYFLAQKWFSRHWLHLQATPL